MAGITLAQAEVQLAAYLAAETAVLSGQSYEIAGRRLAAIQEGIKVWSARVDTLSASSSGIGRTRTIVLGR